MTRESKSVTIGAIAASVGCIALSFAPWFREVAVVWWMLGAAGVITAFVAEMRSRRRRTRTFAFSSVAFVAAAAAAIALVGVISPARAEAATPSASAAPTDLSRVEQLVSQLDEQDGTDRSRAIATARSMGYSVRSGLDEDWSAAAAYSYEGADVVSVPLLGTDVPEMTKLSFVTADGATVVTEMAAAMTSATAVHFAMWQDGHLTKNVDLVQGANSEQASSIGTYGLDWKRLNNCLNSIGISWAVIAILGVACGAACATMVLCAPCLAAAAGFTTGTIAKCVSNAWR
ncbi:hypothetical protein [Curtobacterium sp. VKM Ac-1393]|uniref:hypothetical protein n=1 Tax=Curtobacterium sp. VKM Ac-1393 TaxID=2783814 RepID=UPI00188B75E9|nr:hypothetical protein [Curtobacterium sp. VKM Ac-1393]MBF4606210.1 hypothetical protein [Curtobacterium sp. VKM Ac-1393]